MDGQTEVSLAWRHLKALVSEEVVTVYNDAKTNGRPQQVHALEWFNHASIILDEDDDAVHLCLSVGDPRGHFVFTVRRLPDGRMIIRTPYPGELLAHEETEKIRDGFLQVK